MSMYSPCAPSNKNYYIFVDHKMCARSWTRNPPAIFKCYIIYCASVPTQQYHYLY